MERTPQARIQQESHDRHASRIEGGLRAVYNPPYLNLLDSSVWLEPNATVFTWVAFLGSMDAHGFCRIESIEHFTRRAKIKPGKLRQALAFLESPDTSYPALTRIKRCAGGWQVCGFQPAPRILRDPIPQSIKQFIYARDGGKCVFCASMDVLEYDHVIPWSEGGADTVENLQLLCRPCNRAKGPHRRRG
jgi:hypothetical protein